MVDFTFAHREEGFDEHIDKSIRGYQDLLSDIVSLSRYFVEKETNVYDIGCSTGKLTEAMLKKNQDIEDVHYYGIEVADGFVGDMKSREIKLNSDYSWNKIKFLHEDVRDSMISNASLITSVFTLQFMSMRDRLPMIKKVYNGLNEGGAFIFAEKTICENAKFQEMITFNFYDYKRKFFDTKDIMDKEQTLRNIMKPNTWKQIEKYIYDAGFKDVQPFWRNHMFVGAIAVK
tara:strand:+ start:22864 stop:23556 length:693 start_codon:yes stop_codon:yes gene_type:complete